MKQEYLDMPFQSKVMGTLMSMTIDIEAKAIYFSSDNGIYQLYDGKMQKICSDKGFLFYDSEGLVVYNTSVPYVIRLRNELLYPQKEVIIDLE